MSWILNEEVLAVILVIVIISGIIATIQVFNPQNNIESFSELGLLGKRGMIGDYPRQVVAGQPFLLYIYIGNHEGKTVYYKILVKTGDKSSVINETTPLNAEPIMEFRVVLTHNSSIKIPVNITLEQPATNLRLVFEMWIYNETSGNFIYYNRWNQLWLNVTGGLMSTGESQKTKQTLSEDLEKRIIEGYLSIRRAERDGGNVSEMVNLINQAIQLAFKGDEANANELIDEIIAMEPIVSRLGLETSRMKLYTNIAMLTAISSIGITSFIFLRQRIWIYWARIHKDWKIISKKNNMKLSNLEKIILNEIKNKETRLGEIVFSPTMKYKAHEIAKTIYKLARKDEIKLIDPKPPLNFLRYILSRYNLGFAIITSLVALAILSVYGSDSFSALTSLRIILGSLLVLFMPGYSLIEALYPKEEDLTPLERLALSIGLSLAIVPLIGLVLNYTPWGIRLDPILVALSTLTLILMFLSSYRKFEVLRLKVSTTNV